MTLVSPSGDRPLVEGGALPRKCLWRLLLAVTVALIAMGLMRETAPVKVGR